MSDHDLGAFLFSAHPEMVILPDLCVARKILSSEYQPYASGKILARLDLDQIPSFLDGH